TWSASYSSQCSPNHLTMFVSILLLCVFIFFIILHLKSQRPNNFPPGPPVLPLLGNILQLNLENPLKDFERLRKSYGDVYSIFIGRKPAVVINGMKAVKEAIVTKATDFAGRPQDMFINEVTQRKGVIMADYGSSWREHRRFHANLMSSTNQKVKPSLTYLSLQLYDTFPVIRHLPLPFQKTCKSLAIDLINEHKETRVPGEPRDFIDCYLDELEKVYNGSSSFSEEQLIMNSLDLHGAGTDTTSNSLLTGFLYLMNYPHIQERCQQEIDRVLEGNCQASFEDRHKMPYTQAVIHEVQRVANTVPTALHCTTRDTELMGYSIPKGTLIIENLTSVLNEEGQWKFPHEFNPENFLNDQGEFVKPEAFMPFSAGPRVCLGEGLARMELFLMMVTLLRKFKFIWPEEAGEPDFTQVYGITMSPKPYFIKWTQDKN
uniref:Cytochrome P450, family 2, subfamily X, polypeptide 9 n=1 Tax=Amphilophus citrinellus TaxID=61819 RepID=A0A3Q0S9X5_AMPCI